MAVIWDGQAAHDDLYRKMCTRMSWKVTIGLALAACGWLWLAVTASEWLRQALLGCGRLWLALAGSGWVWQAGCQWLLGSGLPTDSISAS